MKGRCFQGATLVMVLALACMWLPATAQKSPSNGCAARHIAGPSLRNPVYVAGLGAGGGIVDKVAFASVHWVPVRPPDRGIGKKHEKFPKHLIASEGGSPWIYLLLAALACCGAILLGRWWKRV